MTMSVLFGPSNAYLQLIKPQAMQTITKLCTLILLYPCGFNDSSCGFMCIINHLHKYITGIGPMTNIIHYNTRSTETDCGVWHNASAHIASIKHHHHHRHHHPTPKFPSFYFLNTLCVGTHFPFNKVSHIINRRSVSRNQNSIARFCRCDQHTCFQCCQAATDDCDISLGTTESCWHTYDC